MGKQQVIGWIVKHVRLPVWKRLMLVTTLLFFAVGFGWSDRSARSEALVQRLSSTHPSSVHTEGNWRSASSSSNKPDLLQISIPFSPPPKSAQTTEPLASVVPSQSAYANSIPQNGTAGSITYNPVCDTSAGGNGGAAGYGSPGGGGSAAGDCVIYGNKGETGGNFSGYSSGGNITFAHPNRTTGRVTYNPVCHTGAGGNGGVARYGSTGAGGGPGGDCLIYGNKAETGGTFTDHTSGGNIYFGP